MSANHSGDGSGGRGVGGASASSSISSISSSSINSSSSKEESSKKRRKTENAKDYSDDVTAAATAAEEEGAANVSADPNAATPEAGSKGWATNDDRFQIPPMIKCLSWNVACDTNDACVSRAAIPGIDGAMTMDTVGKVIGDERPDVLALQETPYEK